jgi:hypothetical protein
LKEALLASEDKEERESDAIIRTHPAVGDLVYVVLIANGKPSDESKTDCVDE